MMFCFQWSPEGIFHEREHSLLQKSLLVSFLWLLLLASKLWGLPQALKLRGLLLLEFWINGGNYTPSTLLERVGKKICQHLNISMRDYGLQGLVLLEFLFIMRHTHDSWSLDSTCSCLRLVPGWNIHWSPILHLGSLNDHLLLGKKGHEIVRHDW